MFAFVRIARISCLIAFCCGNAFADMHPASPSASTIEPNGGAASDSQLSPQNKSGSLALPKLASLAPEMLPNGKSALPTAEPFDFPATIASARELRAKWNELQSRVFTDQKTIAACRLDESTCSPAARRFLLIVELGWKHEGRTRLGWINRAVNMSIKPTSDWVQYGYADFWASPLQTLASEAGDCEDYAIVKYVALRELGIEVEDLRFVIVRDDKHQAEHAVVAVRDDQQWLILDNRTMMILNAEDARNYRPLLVLDQRVTRTIAAAAADRFTDR